MICEPYLNLPQALDLNEFRLSDKPYFAAQERLLKVEGRRKILVHEAATPNEYKVLPAFSHRNDHLRSVLSLKENEYLSCRWQRFLENIPPNYVRIALYMDFKKKKPPVRRMQLTGEFYGVGNKLAPIPVLPDPRSSNKTYHGRCLRGQSK